MFGFITGAVSGETAQPPGVEAAARRLAASSALTVCNLTCDGSPTATALGIDIPHCALGWELSSSTRGERQTAWEIKVASSPASLASDHPDLWSSGRTASDQTQQIPYAGAPLASSQRAYWQVRVWDQNNLPSAWSAVSSWTMGLLDPADWKGAWISSPGETESLLLRREFIVRPGLRRAVVHLCGLGEYELRLNGAKVGQDILSPGWTDYEKTELYDTTELTSRLRPGRNALGLMLGTGMYDVIRRDRFVKFAGWSGPLRAILHLRLEYEDGTVQFVGTDDNWRTLAGPITAGGIYSGEDYDARLEPAGWDRAGFDDRRWLAAVRLLREGGRLAGHSVAADPIREIEVNRPIGRREFPDGTVVYDLGQNASHIPRIKVSGPAGSRVRLMPAEVLNEDGTINAGTMGEKPERGYAWWQYTKATDGPETWQPRFSYIGCRYLKAILYPPDAVAQPALSGEPAADTSTSGMPRIDELGGVVIHSIAAPIGEFSTSNELLNRIRTLVRWAQRSNMVSVLTDCPHREKLGWLEQYHLNGPAIRYEFDVDRIYTKGMHDMADAQHANGLMPEIAPEYDKFKAPFNSAAEWGAALIFVPWQQYQFTGDASLLRRYYPAMKRYFAYLESQAKSGILSEGLGDWFDLGPKKPGYAQLTAAPVTATAFYFGDARILAQTATVLGRADDAAKYAAKAEKIRTTFNTHFYNRENGYYGGGILAASSQCANALPLVLGIVDEPERPRVMASLVAQLDANQGEMTAGDIGFRFLLQALADGGRSDLIYRMINQDQKPGYAFQLKLGATSLTESWDANNHSSHDHFMLGQITEWFYKDLAGLQTDPKQPGFKNIILRPAPVGDLTWVQASYRSVRGSIAVRWERQAGKFTLKATIPPNTTATIYLPAAEGAAVTESGIPAESSTGVHFLRRDGDRSVYTVASGTYTFATAN